VGEERVIAFDMPGTTRDSIEIPFERDGKQYTLIDTAGIRRRGKVFEAIEKFSVVKTLQSISEANVVVLLLDASRTSPSRTPTSPASCWKRAARWWSPSTSGTAWKRPARRDQDRHRPQAGLPRSPRCTSFRR
jgi:tRNA U34 5-carboxymethylaminomethyl modifying GTPase MnmE/TrmE